MIAISCFGNCKLVEPVRLRESYGNTNVRDANV